MIVEGQWMGFWTRVRLPSTPLGTLNPGSFILPGFFCILLIGKGIAFSFGKHYNIFVFYLKENN